MSQRNAPMAGLRADPLEETHQNLEMPQLLGLRAARALSHLNPQTAPRIDALRDLTHELEAIDAIARRKEGRVDGARHELPRIAFFERKCRASVHAQP